MGAKSFTGTPKMQKKIVPKDKLKCTMKMATVNVILEDGGIHTKLISTVIYLRLLNMVSF